MELNSHLKYDARYQGQDNRAVILAWSPVVVTFTSRRPLISQIATEQGRVAIPVYFIGGLYIYLFQFLWQRRRNKSVK